MTNWSPIFILVALMVSLPSFADVESCATRLIPQQDVKNFKKMLTKEPSVEVVGEIAGSHGGRLTIIERTAAIDSWFSSYSAIALAQQGDPRHVVHFFGSGLAYFFGVREVSSTRITIPDADEINGAIRKLNKALIELGFKPIPVSYYAQAVIANPSPEESLRRNLQYLVSWIQNFQLPFAVLGPVRVHDVAYHLFSVMMPVELLEPVQAQFKWALRFHEYLRSAVDPELFVQLQKSFLEVLELNLDVGLGNFQNLYLPWAESPLENIQETRKMNTVGYWLQLCGNPLDSLFLSSLQKLPKELRAKNNKLIFLVRDFWAHEKVEASVFTQRTRFTEEQLDQAIKARRDELLKALAHLQMEKS